MNSELTDIYDKHILSDVFTRYHQNARLLEILATEISGNPGTHHLSIGFSGRLSLFDALAESLTVVNLSPAQIDLGIRLQKELVELFAAPQCALWQPIRDDVDCQMTVLRNCNRTPTLPKTLNSLCFDITKEMYLLPSSAYTSISIIDVLLHVARIEPIIGHLRRILAPGGKAILTVYPPGGEQHLNEFVLTSPALWGGEPRLPANSRSGYYFPEEGLLDLQAIRQAVEDKGSIPPEIYKKFWLDLPGVFLHPASEVTDSAQEFGLQVQLSEQVPGGMFPVARQALVLRRRSE
jgi:SAM-dependent methyltransferase